MYPSRVGLCLAIIRFSFSFARIIDLPNGQMRGALIEDYYYSYTNVPYAEPPVRFEPSKPYESCWEGIKNATGEMARCVQFTNLNSTNISPGQEDCLFLNIFVPKNATTQNLLPVFVYIHGGAFMFGESGIYSPKNIMSEGGMVVVTLNYRFGPFGFLTTGDGIIPGNLGMKDQQLALRWIKQYIGYFGGDPDKILLTGQSAGGSSVHLHMLNKETESLVSAAVAISGTALNPWVMQINATEKTKTLATHLNCSLNGVELKLCLQDQPSEKIVAAVLKMLKFLDNPFNLFGPVAERENTPDAFMTSEPRSLIERGEIANVPFMITMTTEEGAFNAASLLRKNENGVDYIEELNERWSELAPFLLFYYNESGSKCKCKHKLSESLKEMYMGNERFSRETYLLLQKMFTDVLFVNGILETIQLHRKFGSSPVYGYVYANPHNYGVGNFLAQELEFQFGATHGDDEALFLPFTFSTNYTAKANDLKITKYFINMFESFVSAGIPQFKDTCLPENRNNAEPMQFLQLYEQTYCVGPWSSNKNQNYQNQTAVCFEY